MSGTVSAAVRFEDHVGPLVADIAPASEPTCHGSPTAPDTARLRHLTQHIRACVVKATATTDVAQKVELWENYRTARAEALAMLASVSEASRTGRLHSV